MRAMMMMMMSEYLFPDAVVVVVVAAAGGGVMVVILLPLMLMTTVMEEQHDNNFEAATMLLIRAYQLGSASYSLSLQELAVAGWRRAARHISLSFSSYQKGASSLSFVIDSFCTK
jgi:hypothetical protein